MKKFEKTFYASWTDLDPNWHVANHAYIKYAADTRVSFFSLIKLNKDVFEKLWISGGEVDETIQKEGLEQVTNLDEIESMIDEVIQSNPQQLSQYKAGKDRLFGFFVGQVMKASEGKANPKQVNDILKEKLEK